MKLVATTIAMIIAGTPAVTQNAVKGEQLFRRCATCHMIGDEARNRVGPVLTGVIGRPAGSYEAFAYSKSMLAANESGLVWSQDQIVTYLENPTEFLRYFLQDPRARAKMTFRLRDEQDRRDVVTYLATFGPQGQAMTGSGICVTNGSNARRFFAVEERGGARELAELAPSETLCTTALDGASGVVSVFETAQELEGCSRLVIGGEVETLISYANFDRCAWSSHSQATVKIQ